MRKPSKEIRDILSDNIKKFRKELDLSQEAFAHKCNLHRTYIGAVERGERNITLSSLETIASALDIDVPYLLTAQKKEN
jgi:transcriptional regulator with XRE-family HTH domain